MTAPVPFSASGVVATRVVSTAAGLAAAREDWDALARRGAAVGLFQDHAWLQAWWRAVAADAAMSRRYGLHLVVLDDAHGPAAIAPLVVRRDRWPKRLQWMAADVSDYCDVVAAPGADAALLWPALKLAMKASGAGLVELAQIRPDGEAARLLGAMLDAAGGPAASPFVDLAGRSWEQVEQGLSAQLRQEMRRKGRRLAKRADWAYAEYAEPAKRLAAVEFVVQQKRDQFAGDKPALETLERVFAPFAREVFARDRVGAARTHVSALESGGRFIAAHLGFVDAGRFYYWVPAYDPRFQADSPGQLLIYELLRRACETGAKVFDMLRGDYPYKWRLTDTAVELQTLSKALTISGAAYLSLKKIVKRVRGK
ncbi:MAG: GNAT family N-acetyltransferase [Rhodospirillales bacterium]